MTSSSLFSLLKRLITTTRQSANFAQVLPEKIAVLDKARLTLSASRIWINACPVEGTTRRKTCQNSLKNLQQNLQRHFYRSAHGYKDADKIVQMLPRVRYTAVEGTERHLVLPTRFQIGIYARSANTPG
jgi:hypothetical protein